MICLSSLVLALAASVVALPSEIGPRDVNDNYYSSSWSDGSAKMNYKSGSGGLYSVSWSGNKGNFVVGKGWNPGGPKYDIPSTHVAHGL